MDREYYSVPEAAALLGLSRIAVFKKVKNGQLAAIRFGRNWAVPAAALEGLLESRRAAALPAAEPPAPPSVPAAAPPEESRPSPGDEMDSMGWD